LVFMVGVGRDGDVDVIDGPSNGHVEPYRHRNARVPTHTHTTHTAAKTHRPHAHI